MYSAIVVDMLYTQTGFCDRLRLLTFGYTLAKLEQLPLYVVNWNVNEHCPYELPLDLFKDFTILTNISENINTLVFNSSPRSPVNYFFCLHFVKNHNNYFFCEQWRKSYSDIDLNKYCNVSLPDNTIGIHLRGTDYFYFRAHFNNIFKFAFYLIECYLRFFKPKNVYFATDDEKLILRFKTIVQNYGGNFIKSPHSFDTKKFRQTTLEALLFDICCLSQCKFILSNTFSGVAEMAANISRSSLRVVSLLHPRFLIFAIWFYMRKRFRFAM